MSEADLVAEMFKQGLASASTSKLKEPYHEEYSLNVPKDAEQRRICNALPKKEQKKFKFRKIPPEEKKFLSGLNTVLKFNRAIQYDRNFFLQGTYVAWAVMIGVDPSVILARYHERMREAKIQHYINVADPKKKVTGEYL